MAVIPPGANCADLVQLKGKPIIGDGINEALQAIAKANELGTTITQADFDDKEKLGKDKARVERLSRLIGSFEHPGLHISRHQADGSDILGDA